MEKKKYDSVGSFINGFACVELSKKYGFINEKGEEITPIKYDYVWSFHNGFARVKLSTKWGFINEKGEEITPIKYDEVGVFHNGFANVRISKKYGVINTEGKEIIPCKYTSGEITPILENLIKNGEPKNNNKKDDLLKLFNELFDYAWGLAQTSDEYAKLNEIKERI